MSPHNQPPSMDTKAMPRLTDNMGNGLFATKDINVGEDVLKTNRPFVAVLDTPKLEDTCSGCFGKKQFFDGVKPPKACTGCKVVRYCDRACQSKDWKFAHSLECSIYCKLQPKILPNFARAVLRIILRRANQKYDDSEFDIFQMLETHAAEIRDTNQDQWNRILLTAKAVKEYSRTDMKEESIASFLAKIDLNTFNLVNPLYDRVGLYLHPYAAFINHSCDYNSVVGFDGDELFIKATRPIKADEQIFISYVDATYPYNVRRKELAERYYFECNCSKCEQGKETREDQFLPTSLDPSTLEDIDERARNLVASASADNDALQSMEKLRSALRMLRETSAWPITRQPYVSLRDELIIAMAAAKQFQSAFVQMVIRYLRVDPIVYPYEGHPIRQVHTYALVKVAMNLNRNHAIGSPDAVFQKFPKDMDLIIWVLLSQLVKSQQTACTVPSFRELVNSTYRTVDGEFKKYGLEPEKFVTEIKEEWEKLEATADEALKME
ncbi:hypothetical protein C8Q69DRAFT_221290 [Paecilomyces variotii]|uniref:Uncharacterized protein n=1 Tax=Byssochlamys spectabilis TaxID=264951 RepID=A0A443HZN1_BYSSP|nr:hypothetical protein C8Q69DRAFT_221290 [Paecilomyces variotii]KAJ9361721.1 hypothetical protein DTO280E4_3759 [Paecilomyces variotii]RWQ97223.1 hypothetical protein C8Q69DRAFT_221290 [Paecilomyces variotii]